MRSSSTRSPDINFTTIGQPVNRAIGTQIGADTRNPYKGLRAFHEADAGDFAGRDRLVDQIVDLLGFRRAVAVVGPSGSGKSSVVRAGLLPALRNNAVPRSDEWFVTSILPGAHPFEELEAALTKLAADQPTRLLDLLTDGARGIGRAIRRVLPENGQLLLVIDQFEEIFTMCPDETERREFLDGLANAIAEERSRVRVVFTLRADFYDRPLRYESIGRLVRDATIAVLPLAADELEHAIVDPARSVGAEFEPGLVSELVADVSDEPGALPMLQYALTELYDRRVANLITRDAYADIGGLAGALSKRAEDLYAAASEDHQAAVRRIFGRLVTLGEGTEDTRRRATRSELATSQPAIDVIDAFGRARLLSFDTDPSTREPTIEVAHEALIREWPRFSEWLDEDRESLRTLRHINTASVAWLDAGRAESEVYRGGRLESAEAWFEENIDELSADEREFVAAGVRRRDEEHMSERRSRRRLQRLLAGVAVIAVMAMLAGAFAFQQQRSAADERDRAAASEDAAVEAATEAETQQARAETLAATAEATLLGSTALDLADTDRRLALLLAVEGLDLDPTLGGLGRLQQVLVNMSGIVAYVGSEYSYLTVRWLDDTTVVALRRDGIDVYDVQKSELIATHATRPDTDRSGSAPMDLASNFGLVAVGVDYGIGQRGVEIFNFVTGQRRFVRLASSVTAVAMSPSGTLLAVGDSSRNITLIDPQSGAEVGLIDDAHPEGSYDDVVELVEVGLSQRLRQAIVVAVERTMFGASTL